MNGETIVTRTKYAPRIVEPMKYVTLYLVTFMNMQFIALFYFTERLAHLQHYADELLYVNQTLMFAIWLLILIDVTTYIYYWVKEMVKWIYNKVKRR